MLSAIRNPQLKAPLKKKNSAIYFCWEEEDEESLLNQPQFINRYKVEGNSRIFLFLFLTRKRAS